MANDSRGVKGLLAMGASSVMLEVAIQVLSEAATKDKSISLAPDTAGFLADQLRLRAASSSGELQKAFDDLIAALDELGAQEGEDWIGFLYRRGLFKAAHSAAKIDRVDEDPYKRRPTADLCKCNLHTVPAGIDRVNWYWARHAREECTVELPNLVCWCGRTRAEHQNKDGHNPRARVPEGGS
jgi:hypothetical protein